LLRELLVHALQLLVFLETETTKTIEKTENKLRGLRHGLWQEERDVSSCQWCIDSTQIQLILDSLWRCSPILETQKQWMIPFWYGDTMRYVLTRKCDNVDNNVRMVALPAAPDLMKALQHFTQCLATYSSTISLSNLSSCHPKIHLPTKKLKAFCHVPCLHIWSVSKPDLGTRMDPPTWPWQGHPLWESTT